MVNDAILYSRFIIWLTSKVSHKDNICLFMLFSQGIAPLTTLGIKVCGSIGRWEMGSCLMDFIRYRNNFVAWKESWRDKFRNYAVWGLRQLEMVYLAILERLWLAFCNIFSLCCFSSKIYLPSVFISGVSNSLERILVCLGISPLSRHKLDTCM